MSKLELIKHLFAYNEWANERLLDAAARVTPPEQLAAPHGSSHASALAELEHIAESQLVWLSRWRDGRNPENPAGVQARSLADVSAVLGQAHDGIGEYLNALTEDAVNATLYYQDSRGNEYSRVLWQLMVHVATHGTYHRGEVALILSGLGQSPGDLDFVYWERDREDRPSPA